VWQVVPIIRTEYSHSEQPSVDAKLGQRLEMPLVGWDQGSTGPSTPERACSSVAVPHTAGASWHAPMAPNKGSRMQGSLELAIRYTGVPEELGAARSARRVAPGRGGRCQPPRPDPSLSIGPDPQSPCHEFSGTSRWHATRSSPDLPPGRVARPWKLLPGRQMRDLEPRRIGARIRPLRRPSVAFDYAPQKKSGLLTGTRDASQMATPGLAGIGFSTGG
jgi:hypothetical protein